MVPGRRWWSACVWLVAVSSMILGHAVHAKDKKDKKGKKDKTKPTSAVATAATGDGQRFTVDGVREPSGIALHPRLHHLFVVGDEGTVGEIDHNGRTIRADAVPGNLEDLAFHPGTGTFVLLSEKHAQLVVYDPVAHLEKRRIPFDTDALLGQVPQVRKGQGFEGLAFRPESGRPGGGVFYLAFQHSPPLVVAVAFDPDRAVTLGKDAVVGRWDLADRYHHLTAISYEPSLDRFLLIADRRLVVLRTDGTTESESPRALPLRQPEGVCLDESGALWIADDPTGLVRFAAGPSALAGASGGPGGPGRNR